MTIVTGGQLISSAFLCAAKTLVNRSDQLRSEEPSVVIVGPIRTLVTVSLDPFKFLNKDPDMQGG